MLVELFITMRDGSMHTMYALSDMVKITLRLFPGWSDCEVYTAQEPVELAQFPNMAWMPLRRLHNCVVQ